MKKALLTLGVIMISMTVQAQAQVPIAGEWLYETEIDRFTDARNSFAVVFDTEHNTLGFACQEGQFFVLYAPNALMMDAYNINSIKVKYRLDSGSVIEDKWHQIDGDAAIVGDRASSFIHLLMEAQEGIVISGDGETSEFGVVNVSTSGQQILADCGK